MTVMQNMYKYATCHSRFPPSILQLGREDAIAILIAVAG
jgi:hypothetical protein